MLNSESNSNLSLFPLVKPLVTSEACLWLLYTPW